MARGQHQRGAASPSMRRGYHVGSPALVYVGVTLFVALGAFNSQNNLLFWTFGLALGVLTVSGIISGTMLMGVRVTREHVSEASAGEPLVIRYRVSNTNRIWPVFALHVEEIGFQRARPARWRLSALWSRQVTPGTTMSLIEPPSAFVEHVSAGESIVAESQRSALARGRVVLTGVRVYSGFPFGLLRKSVSFHQPGELLVRPKPEHAERSSAAPRAGSGGETAARRSGRGDEFFALRDFREGDAPRTVAWRASARRGKLIVREFATSSPARLMVDLVLRPGTAHADENERSIRVAAGLAQAAGRAGVPVGLTAAGVGLAVPLGLGSSHQARILDELAAIDLGTLDERDRTDAAALAEADELRDSSRVRVSAGGLEGPGAEDWAVVDPRVVTETAA